MSAVSITISGLSVMAVAPSPGLSRIHAERSCAKGLAKGSRASTIQLRRHRPSVCVRRRRPMALFKLHCTSSRRREPAKVSLLHKLLPGKAAIDFP
ncbi:uncharacterized protein BDR25DRAFT_74983 [Lindgomyces ingoldianus]|uniref:Uncharacterized protein n=1 Tax=Lindgomyces ingoldianus TaxID=673940 RepID=A0ACB6QIK3_9PLEO|nr:uncharacterized protein BDR25DRAFT_74983 [Lindgomyces ingoldianus]KAF2466779.1 hypothetical protein BDR25DRAFT_74983 [Lindgomyces ingoldianus]